MTWDTVSGSWDVAVNTWATFQDAVVEGITVGDGVSGNVGALENQFVVCIIGSAAATGAVVAEWFGEWVDLSDEFKRCVNRWEFAHGYAATVWVEDANISANCES